MIYHSHGDNVHDERRQDSLLDLGPTVRDAVADLGPFVRRAFDGIIVTGVSGLVVGGPVAVELQVPLFVVRKPEDDTHDWEKGVVNPKDFGAASRLLFLDDFVSSGQTRWRVVDAVMRYGQPYGAEVTASYMYRERKFVSAHPSPMLAPGTFVD